MNALTIQAVSSNLASLLFLRLGSNGEMRTVFRAKTQNPAGRGGCGVRPTGALPILTFVLTLGVFALAPQFERDTFGPTLNSRKTMKNNGFHRSSSEDCALSSVEEHFLHTEGVAGSSPAARTILSLERRKGG